MFGKQSFTLLPADCFSDSFNLFNSGAQTDLVARPEAELLAAAFALLVGFSAGGSFGFLSRFCFFYISLRNSILGRESSVWLLTTPPLWLRFLLPGRASNQTIQDELTLIS